MCEFNSDPQLCHYYGLLNIFFWNSPIDNCLNEEDCKHSGFKQHNVTMMTKLLQICIASACESDDYCHGHPVILKVIPPKFVTIFINNHKLPFESRVHNSSSVARLETQTWLYFCFFKCLESDMVNRECKFVKRDQAMSALIHLKRTPWIMCH